MTGDAKKASMLEGRGTLALEEGNVRRKGVATREVRVRVKAGGYV
jgi:hypothetical protein